MSNTPTILVEVLESSDPNIVHATYVWHLWGDYDDSEAIGLPEVTTLGGRPLLVRRRDVARPVRFMVRASQITLPGGSIAYRKAYQNRSLTAQIRELFTLKGHLVRVTSTKHDRVITGIVEEISLHDTGDIDEITPVMLGIKEVSTERGVGFGKLTVAHFDPGVIENVDAFGVPYYSTIRQAVCLDVKAVRVRLDAEKTGRPFKGGLLDVLRLAGSTVGGVSEKKATKKTVEEQLSRAKFVDIDETFLGDVIKNTQAPHLPKGRVPDGHANILKTFNALAKQGIGPGSGRYRDIEYGIRIRNIFATAIEQGVLVSGKPVAGRATSSSLIENGVVKKADYLENAYYWNEANHLLVTTGAIESGIVKIPLKRDLDGEC